MGVRGRDGCAIVTQKKIPVGRMPHMRVAPGTLLVYLLH